jgi:gas vesicle protein
MKYSIGIVIGIIIGALSAFIVAARLSAEIEAQARLTSLMAEISTISIYMKDPGSSTSFCFLKRTISDHIREGNEIVQWISERKLKFSGLNDLSAESFQQTIDSYNRSKGKQAIDEYCDET